MALVTELYTEALRSGPKSAPLELVPDPAPAARRLTDPAEKSKPVDTVPDKPSAEPVQPAAKYDNTPGRKNRAHYQQQLAKVRASLVAGTCKPNARAIGKCAGCNMQRAQSIATDLVDAGVLERLPNRRMRVANPAAAA